jgi:hypothetical protein
MQMAAKVVRLGMAQDYAFLTDDQQYLDPTDARGEVSSWPGVPMILRIIDGFKFHVWKSMPQNAFDLEHSFFAWYLQVSHDIETCADSCAVQCLQTIYNPDTQECTTKLHTPRHWFHHSFTAQEEY